eukprot:48119_1
MMQLSLYFTELMGTIKSKSSKQQQHHIISNKNDAIITVTGYIRFAINEIIYKQQKQYTSYSLWNLLQQNSINYSSITSYESIPICIINLIINFYYYNEKENINKMDIPPLTLSSLKVGDKIDAKDDWEKYYPATILYIKQPHSEFPNNTEIQRLSVSPGIKYLYPNDWVCDMGLFIHYNGCSSRYDEWIFIKKHTICDCNDICHYKDLHFISKPNTQSKQTGLIQNPQFGNTFTNIIGLKNCVGLANLGNTSWLNCILQSLYHTQQFKSFIIKGKYLPNKYLISNNTNKKRKIYQQFINKHKLLFKLHNLFANINANEFGIVSPIHIFNTIFNNKLYNIPLKFNINNGDKPIQFLQWFLNILSQTEYIKDMIISTFEGRYLNNKHIMNMKEYDNKLINNGRRFGRKYSDHKNEQMTISDHHSTFLTLTLPIPNGMQRDFIIDIYDSRNYKLLNKNGLNLPIRHRLTLPRNGTVSDLENIIHKLYDINLETECIFFYRLWGFRCCYVWNGFEPLTDVDDNIACYIINNWQSTNHICHIHHVRPINKPEVDDDIDNEESKSSEILLHDNYCFDSDSDNDSDNSSETDLDISDSDNISISSNGYMYGNNNNNIFLRHHKQVHMNDKHVIHPYAFGQPFIISMPDINTSGRLVHKIIYCRLYSWIGNTMNILCNKPPEIYCNEDETIEDKWDIILINLPYKLRWVHKDYNFYFDAYKPPIVIPDDVNINYTWNYHANIVIEWNQNIYQKIKILLNKISIKNRYSNIYNNNNKCNKIINKCVHDVDVIDIY